MSNSNPFANSGGYPPPPPSTIYTASSSAVYQQIEGSANYYPPSIYALLSFYGALSNLPDELDGNFIPISDVQPTTAQQTLIFAVGILPPSSQVTGNLLDRSATIAQTAPLNTSNLNPQTGQERVTAPPVAISAGPKSTTSSNPYAQFVCMCNTLGQQPEAVAQVLYSESGFQPGATNPSIAPGTGLPAAIGLNQISGVNPSTGGYAGSTADFLGLSQEQYANFGNLSISQQLPYVQKSFASSPGLTPGMTAAQLYALNLRPSGLNPDGTIYNSSISSSQAAAVAGNPTAATTVNGVSVITPESLTAGLLRPLPPSLQASLDQARQELGMTNPSTTVTPSANAANGWQGTGSPNANTAMATIQTYQNSNLNTSNLGQQFMAAQQATIMATIAAIQQMQNTPPLKMLVNPQSFKLSAEKIIADSEWSRNGPIVEYWGEQLDKIEGSGKIAAFYAIDQQQISTIPGVGAGPGLTRIARQYSGAYQNFLALWLLYKNNGGIWLADFINSNTTQTSNLSVLGSIYLFYDNILYLGSFDSFNITESETAPFTLEYNFQFTVRATFLLDNTDDISLSLTTLAESQNFAATGLPPPISTNSPIVGQQPAGRVAPPPGFLEQQQAQNTVNQANTFFPAGSGTGT